jgi:hypothetical protein
MHEGWLWELCGIWVRSSLCDGAGAGGEGGTRSKGYMIAALRLMALRPGNLKHMSCAHTFVAV